MSPSKDNSTASLSHRVTKFFVTTQRPDELRVVHIYPSGWWHYEVFSPVFSHDKVIGYHVSSGAAEKSNEPEQRIITLGSEITAAKVLAMFPDFDLRVRGIVA